MTPSASVSELEDRRDRLRADLAAVGDFRPGSLSQVMRRCGKPNCACADPQHPGHGPQHVLTRKVAGKTRTVHLRVGPELDTARAEVDNYKQFRRLVQELIEVNEAICVARAAPRLAPEPSSEDEPAGTSGQKGGPS